MDCLDAIIEGIRNAESITDNKKSILINFAEEVNCSKIRFDLEFILKNYRYISNNSAERLALLDSRHQQEKASRIVETLPTVLNYSLKRTESIYALLDSRHQQEETNRIVEKLPAVLGCSLARTESIYALLDSRHQQEEASRIVEKLPTVLSCSLKRTKSIYALLDSRHQQEKASRIVETLPAVLSYSLKRTKLNYQYLEEKDIDANGYVEMSPYLLYFSPDFIKNNQLGELLEITRKFEEKRDHKELPSEIRFDDGSVSRFDRYSFNNHCFD
ncbi:MAG: hypothetical protein ABIG89_07320 [Candidatus Woesearchaeota archaeon]